MKYVFIAGVVLTIVFFMAHSATVMALDSDLNVNVANVSGDTPTPTPTATPSTGPSGGGSPGYDSKRGSTPVPFVANQPITTVTPMPEFFLPRLICPLSVPAVSILPGEIIQVPLAPTVKEMNAIRLLTIDAQNVKGLTTYQLTNSTITLTGEGIPHSYIAFMITPDSLVLTTLVEDNGQWRLSFANTLSPSVEHKLSALARNSITYDIIAMRQLISFNVAPSAVVIHESLLSKHAFWTGIFVVFLAWFLLALVRKLHLLLEIERD